MYDWPVCLSTCTHFKEANDLWPGLFQRMFVALSLVTSYQYIEALIELYLTTCEQSLSVALESNNFPFFFKDLNFTTP